MEREAVTRIATIQAQVSSNIPFQQHKPLIFLQAVRPLTIEGHGEQADTPGDNN